MSGEQPLEASSSDSKPTLNELFLRLEALRQSENMPAYISLLVQMLQLISRENDPVTWAAIQQYKRRALCDLIELQSGAERLETLRSIVTCCDAILTVCTREATPANWAIALYNKAMYLYEMTEMLSGDKRFKALQDAICCYDAALTIYTREGAPIEWATMQNSKGMSLHKLAELLERFRGVSDRLAAIMLESSVSTTTLEAVNIAVETAETQLPLELAAVSALNERLASYAEAREARAAYDEVVAIIRQEIPDFLSQDGALEAVTKELRADERLTYVATTPTGAVSLLVGASGDTHDRPTMEGLWDERLTSTLVTHLLVGLPRGDGKQQGARAGLLTAQAHAGRLRRALRATMQTLGASDGVLTHLATRCRTAGVRRLVCVPCGLLGLLPLHAALVPLSSTSELTEPLVDVVRVSYAPSARIWARGRRRSINSSVEKTDALIVGDPQPQSEGTPPLPGARDEAQAISALMSQTIRGCVSTLTGEAATLAGVLDVLRGQCATLTHAHFACHGLAELSNPQTSGMLLAHGARLTARDLLDPMAVHFARLRLAALSACRTALVGTELPDEAIGLPSAWLQAGAESVLASLWPISDSKTLAMMTKFYELHLLDGCEPVDALWLAQRWLRGLSGWQGDCRAAGAIRAAEGPEASKVISALELAGGETVLRDDLENRHGNEHGGDAVAPGIQGEKTTARTGDSIEEQQVKEYAQHWAAFVIYGS